MKKKSQKKTSKVEQIYSQNLKFSNAGLPSVQPDDLIHSLKLQIEQEWKSKNIPFPLCEIYSLFISSLPKRKSVIFMQKEISDLRSYNSLVQVCLKGINAREESLYSIQDMAKYLSKAVDWDSLADIRIECAEILHAHRMLTLNVAESIERWKELFQYESNGFYASFIYNGENYLLKMRHDLDFLKTSELSKAFDFGQETDPFLLYPSKLIEKHKAKVGSNYFIQDGEVIIPLPSVLLKRVQKMDYFLKEEENRVLLNSDKNRVLGCKGVIFLEDSKQKNESLAKSVAEQIYREHINTQVLIIAQEQINDSVAKFISFDIDEALEPLIEKIVLETLNQLESVGNKDNYLKTEVKIEPSPPSPAEEIKPIFQLSPNKLESIKRSSINAQKLQNFTAIEWYIRKLIEELIDEADLESIVNQCIGQILVSRAKTAGPEEKRRLTLVYQNLQEEKLIELVFLDVLEEFVEMDWVLTLASSMLIAVRNPDRKKTFEPLKINKPDLHVEEAEEFVHEVFTPGVHSPNEVSLSSESENEAVEASHTSEALIKIISEGKKEGNYELSPFEGSSKSAFKSLELYFSNLPDQKIFNSLQNLQKISQSCENCAWFWLKNNEETIGCLIFSNFIFDSRKAAVIHHFSTVSANQSPNLLTKAQVFLTNLTYSSIIINADQKKTQDFLVSTTLTSSKSIKIKFPWSDSIANYTLIDLPDTFIYSNQPQTFKISMQSSSSISLSDHPTEVPQKTSPEMFLIGNRNCILNSLFSILTENSVELSSSQYFPIRLQKDIMELLEIITSLDSFTYPLLSLNKPSAHIYESILNLSFHFPNITTFPYIQNGRNYQYFTLLNVKLYKSDLFSLFEVQTSISDLSAFIILYPNIFKELKTEIKGFKSDLFSKVDSILKTLPDSFVHANISLPGFTINAEWNVTWIKGLNFSEELNKSVQDCIEKVDLRMEFPMNFDGVLKNIDFLVNTEDFVFGLRHKDLDSTLETPLLACLVREENWITLD